MRTVIPSRLRPRDLAGIPLTQACCNSFLPAIGRFLIVVTFIEDALRIITQWNDQLLYLHDYRHSTSSPPASHLFSATTLP